MDSNKLTLNRLDKIIDWSNKLCEAFPDEYENSVELSTYKEVAIRLYEHSIHCDLDKGDYYRYKLLWTNYHPMADDVAIKAAENVLDHIFNGMWVGERCDDLFEGYPTIEECEYIGTRNHYLDSFYGQ